MTLRRLPLSADQTLATQRANQDGSVYLLSGTLKGLGATPDVTFRWATLSFSGVLGDFDAYIHKPSTVVRAHEYAPGGGATFPAVNVPVRNLPFAGSESMLALVDDGNYSWENSEASLLVGYLKPGQRAEDLAAEDFTYLVSGGVLGPPNNVEMDGFTCVVYMRGVRRAQSFSQPRHNSLEEMRGLVSGVVPLPRGMDRKDLGTVLPLAVGRPTSWYRVPTYQVGVRGFAVSGYAAGTTSGIKFRAITDGVGRLNTNHPHKLRLHFRTPVYNVVSGSAVYDEAEQTYTVTLTSGLAADLPRGGFVQEALYGPAGVDNYYWLVAGHPCLDVTTAGDARLQGSIGWLLDDGTIRAADMGTWPFRLGTTQIVHGDSLVSGTGWSCITLELIPDVSGLVNTAPIPCYFEVNQPVEVTQQPTFDQTLRADSKMNYPTGGSGTNNANARDGNTDTGASLTLGATITLTFNSEASGDFADGDTTRSTLHVVTQGNIDFKNTGLTVTFGQATGTGGTNREFTFPQSSARAFNESVVCIGAGGSGGSVMEVWWEHDLSTTKAATRINDVVVGAGGTVGAVMKYAELVFRWPAAVSDQLGSAGTYLKYFFGATAPVMNPFYESETISGAIVGVPYPTSVMPFIQSYFLGPDANGNLGRNPGEGRIALVNSGVYALAHQHYVASGIRWNFVLQEEIRSWAELEQMLALQAQAHFYYGPTGHEIVFKEGLDLAVSGVVQEFRLPGTPRCNTTRASGPLLERMLTTEVINAATARWNPDSIEGGQLRSVTDGRNAESIALFGEKRDPSAQGGAYEFWAHCPVEGHPTFDASAAVSGIVNFYANVAAQARTRFRFDTAWIAHGLERGSPVRVVYAVAEGVFRNVVAEVEEVAVDPINGDRFSIRARALDVPTPGLPVLTWEELFTDASQTWGDHIASGETWKQNWSL